MNKLDKEIDKLKPTRPIFRVDLKEQWDNTLIIRAIPINGPENSGNKDTVMAELVTNLFDERFDSNHFAINKSLIRENCLANIRQTVCSFLEREMAQKHPRETSQYRWFSKKAFQAGLKGHDKHPELENSLINIWEYMASHKEDDDEKLKTRTKNVLGLLKFIYTKYKDVFPL